MSKIIFLSHDECVLWLKSTKPFNKIKNKTDWKKYKYDFPDFIPINPLMFYKGDGWVNWDYFLSVKKNKGEKKYLTYIDCKKWIKKNLKISSKTQWCNNTKRLPEFIPKNPSVYYKNNGWIDWYDFLNKKETKFYSHFQARKWVMNNLRVERVSDWKYGNIDLPEFIPKAPNITYKNNGWISWSYFLGIDVSRKKKADLHLLGVLNLNHQK